MSRLNPISVIFGLGFLLQVGACSRPLDLRPEPARVPVRSEVVQPTPFRPSLTLFGKVEPASRTKISTPRVRHFALRGAFCRRIADRSASASG